MRKKDERKWVALKPRFRAGERTSDGLPSAERVAESARQPKAEDIADEHSTPNRKKRCWTVKFVGLNQTASADDGERSGNQVTKW